MAPLPGVPLRRGVPGAAELGRRGAAWRGMAWRSTLCACRPSRKGGCTAVLGRAWVNTAPRAPCALVTRPPAWSLRSSRGTVWLSHFVSRPDSDCALDIDGPAAHRVQVVHQSGHGTHRPAAGFGTPSAGAPVPSCGGGPGHVIAGRAPQAAWPLIVTFFRSYP